MDKVLTRNHVQVLGDSGPVVVLAHGYGCDQHMWRLVAPALAASHRVVMFDHVGCGRSDLSAWSPQRHGRLQGYAQDVLEVCDALGLDRVAFVGHSVSAMIGALAAIERPALFERLVMIGPSPRYIDEPASGYRGGFARADIEGLLDLMEHNMVGWASHLAPVVMNNPDRPELSAELAASFCASDPDIGRRFARLVFLSDNRADLPLVNVPTLVMQCSEDSIAPEAVGRFVHAQLRDSRFVQLRATGHCPHLSHPDETVAAILAYLAEPLPAA